MDLKIQGRNMEITDRIRRHVNKKLGQIGRYLPGVNRVNVELATQSTRSQKDRVVAQVTVDVSGSVLRAEQRALNTTAAINSVTEVLSRQIERYKGQVYRSERAKQGASLGVQQAEEAAQSDGALTGHELADGELVKIKQFSMKPMTVDDAAIQMQLLGHHFFLFLNGESDQYNVLYLREDGNYGLIQPA